MTAFKINGSNSSFKLDDPAFDSDTTAADSLTVEADGYLFSVNDDAVHLRNLGGAWTTTINGTVFTQDGTGTGIDLAGGITGTSKFTIGESGRVHGSIAMDLGSAASVINKGNITSNSVGILAGANATITNSGIISGSIEAILLAGGSAVTITNTATGLISGIRDTITPKTVTITNSGFISAVTFNSELKNTLTNSGTINAVTFTDGIDIVTNSGKLGAGSLDFLGGNDVFKNTSLIDMTIEMGQGNDQFTGGNGREFVTDNAGSDKYSFGGGDDQFFLISIGGDGTDTVDGGAGSDYYKATFAGVGVNINLDSVAHNFGPFIPSLTLAANTALQGADKDIVKNIEKFEGSLFNDNIAGSAAANILSGVDGSDIIFGYGGNDELSGGNGSDRLIGGAGRDRMTGDSGGDFYIFQKTTDSTPTARDVILTFDDGIDVIDLTAIDANTKNGSATNDAFSYIGQNLNFSGVAGQFRSYFTPDGWIFEGDVNGDKKADIAFEVANDPGHALTWSAVHNLQL
jgi:hypothetical protein